MADHTNLFSTQLSLSKFIKLANRLTPEQQGLVNEIGYGGTLSICCEELPRSLIKWLVSYFNATTRTFNLPNGCSFQLLPFHLNKILGIPVGGRRIGRDCPSWIRELVKSETGCCGKSPTISELDSLITPELVGDKFKRAYLLYVNTVLVFASTCDAASPSIMSAIAITNDINTYDWAGAAFDFLVGSIHRFQTNGLRGALCGFLPAIVVLYFELLDTNALFLGSTLPRISFWNTRNIALYESLDQKPNEKNNVYGNMKLRDMDGTVFAISEINDELGYDVRGFIDKFVKHDLHEEAADALQHIMTKLYADISSAIHTNMKNNVRKISNIVSNLPAKKSVVCSAAECEGSHRVKNAVPSRDDQENSGATQSQLAMYTRLAHEIKLLMEISAIDIKTAQVDYKESLEKIDVACQAVLDALPTFDAFIPTEELLRTVGVVSTNTHSVEIHEDRPTIPSTGISTHAYVTPSGDGTVMPTTESLKGPQFTVAPDIVDKVPVVGDNSNSAGANVASGVKHPCEPCETFLTIQSTGKSLVDCLGLSRGDSNMFIGETTSACQLTTSQGNEKIKVAAAASSDSTVTSTANVAQAALNTEIAKECPLTTVLTDGGANNRVNTACQESKKTCLDPEANQQVSPVSRQIKGNLDDILEGSCRKRKTDNDKVQLGNLSFGVESKITQCSNSDNIKITARSLENEFELAAEEHNVKRQKVENSKTNMSAVWYDENNYLSEMLIPFLDESELAQCSLKNSTLTLPVGNVSSNYLDESKIHILEASQSLVPSSGCMPKEVMKQKFITVSAVPTSDPVQQKINTIYSTSPSSMQAEASVKHRNDVNIGCINMLPSDQLGQDTKNLGGTVCSRENTLSTIPLQHNNDKQLFSERCSVQSYHEAPSSVRPTSTVLSGVNEGNSKSEYVVRTMKLPHFSSNMPDCSTAMHVHGSMIEHRRSPHIIHPAETLDNTKIYTGSRMDSAATTPSNIPTSEVPNRQNQQMFEDMSSSRNMHCQPPVRHIPITKVHTDQCNTSGKEHMDSQYHEQDIQCSQLNRSSLVGFVSDGNFIASSHSEEPCFNKQLNLNSPGFDGQSRRASVNPASILRNNNNIQNKTTRCFASDVNRRDPRVQYKSDRFRTASSLHEDSIPAYIHNATGQPSSQTRRLISYPPMRKSTDLEIAVYNHITETIPGQRARSKKLVLCKKKWADQRILGLSMQVYGRVSPYVMDVMAKIVMAVQFEKMDNGTLDRDFYPRRYILMHEVADKLKEPNFNVKLFRRYFQIGLTGCNLVQMDLIIIPLRPVHVWYAVIVDLAHRKFDVVCSHIGDENIEEEANLVIENFKLAFEDVYTLPYKEHYRHMRTNTIEWISDDVNDSDSGVGLLKLLQTYDGLTPHFFKATDTKTLREQLTFFMLDSKFNEQYLPVEIREIMNQYRGK